MVTVIEPIYIYAKDSGELWKYKKIDDAEIDLEAYDIDNYEAYDSLCRKLEIFPKGTLGCVGFRLVDETTYCNELKQLALKELNNRINKAPHTDSLKDILENISEEKIRK